MSKVTPFIPRDAVVIPRPSPQDWARSQVVAGSVGAFVSVSDPAFTDDEIVSAYRCFAVIYHISRNNLLRTGINSDKLDTLAAEAVATRQARDSCIERSTVASIVKAQGIGFNDLIPEHRVDFLLGAAAMLADVQDEFDRRKLTDPDDPRQSAQ